MISATKVELKNEKSKRKRKKIFVSCRPKLIVFHQKSDFFGKFSWKSFVILKITYNFALSKEFYKRSK